MTENWKGKTCKATVTDGFFVHTCGKPAKGEDKHYSHIVPMCGIHLAGLRRARANRERWAQERIATQLEADRVKGIASRLSEWGAYSSSGKVIIPADKATELADFIESLQSQ